MSKETKCEFIKAVGRVRGGVKVPHRKNTADCKTVHMPAPKTVALMMSQHIGAPAVPCVKKGDSVCVGTMVGMPADGLSVPVYSSVSGTVIDICDMMLSSGHMSKAVVVESDGYNTVAPGINPPEINTKEDLIDAVKMAGIVGLGGAGFPTYVKLSPKTQVDTLVVNGAECEPYITADYREILESHSDILRAVYLIKDMLKLQNVVFVIEDNKPQAINTLLKVVSSYRDYDNSVKVMKVKSTYPRGAEKMTIYSATGRKVPPGKLPSDVGCIVMNITTLGEIGRYIKTGMPLVSKRLTVDGSAVKNPMNVRVPLGASAKDVIEFTGGYKTAPKKIIFGGPMMGFSVPTDEIVVTKHNNAILAFDEKAVGEMGYSDCIRCGRCVKACPMNLMPASIERAVVLNKKDELQALGAINCMECGSCAFICPAKRPLVQTMRSAKDILRK